MGARPDHNALAAAANGDAAVSPARVLVAEDNEIGLEFTCMMARRLGMIADGAHDGHHAVRMVMHAASEGRPYSLVLMDFMMPVVDGIEATRRLRRAGFSDTELPIIALTAVAEPHEIGRFTAAGGQGYLSKPLSIDKLSAVLEAWLPSDSVNENLGRLKHSRSLKTRYSERKQATFARIDAAIALARADEATVEEIRDLLHKLAGTAGLFGDDDLSVAAATCEKQLIMGGVANALTVLEAHRGRLGESA